MHDFQILSIVVEVVAEMARIPASKLYKAARTPTYVKLRDTIFFLIRAKTQLSLPEIGRAFGRDHSSVLVAVKREAQRLERNLRRSDGLTWSAYHERIKTMIDEKIALALKEGKKVDETV